MLVVETNQQDKSSFFSMACNFQIRSSCGKFCRNAHGKALVIVFCASVVVGKYICSVNSFC